MLFRDITDEAVVVVVVVGVVVVAAVVRVLVGALVRVTTCPPLDEDAPIGG